MESMTSNPGQSPSHLANGYPWGALPSGATVVDMGGSKGHVSVAIAKKHPHLQFVVQDLPEVIREESLGEDVDKSVRKRIAFMEHDFLTEQTVKGRVFLLRWVLHDWPDHYVVRILRNLRSVLRKGDKVVVNDQIMPGPGVLNVVLEKQIRSVHCAIELFILAS